MRRAPVGANDWPVYGHDLGNQRYSTLNRITTANVNKLVQAWTFDPRPTPGTRTARQFEGTPLVMNGAMYIVTQMQSLAALDPETGKKLWEFSHKHTGRPPRGAA